ncbi:MAG: glycosyltransferase family 2 protein [Erythrobacter sp.]
MPERLRVVIPMLNASAYLPEIFPALAQQEGLSPAQVLVVDSASDDDTVAQCRAWGAEVMRIERAKFNHGGTRQRAAEHCSDADILIYMTQDAIPNGPQAIARLAAAFDDPAVGMAYGRQLPRKQSTAIERHARLINYPAQSQTRTMQDAAALGAKTYFCSDSFAAYRTTTLREIGGFPLDAFFAEDQIVAGKMLMQGHALSYVGDAEVVHSHNYNLREEMARYFDVGVFHNRNEWLLNAFGKAEKAGASFVSSEIKYLLAHAPLRLPEAFVRTCLKYLGYRLGKMEKRLSVGAKTYLSMQPFYWRRVAREETK